MIKTSYVRKSPKPVGTGRKKRKAAGVVYFSKEWYGKVVVIMPRKEYRELLKTIRKKDLIISRARRCISR